MTRRQSPETRTPYDVAVRRHSAAMKSYWERLRRYARRTGVSIQRARTLYRMEAKATLGRDALALRRKYS